MPRSDFDWDSNSGKFPLHFADDDAFSVWRRDYQRAHGVQFKGHQRRQSDSRAATKPFLWSQDWTCTRKGTGGTKHYVPKHNFTRKVENRRTGCPAAFYIKKYPGRDDILGHWRDECHNHTTGFENLKFTGVEKEVRELIVGYLRSGVSINYILDLLHEGFDDRGILETLRTDLIEADYIRRIQKRLESEYVHFSTNDGISTLDWVAKLKADDAFLGYKGVNDDPPDGSHLPTKAFFLAIQTPYQRTRFAQLASTRLVCIDGTHNTTMYQGMQLYTLICRDGHGKGVPTAWLLSNSGTEETLSHFLRLVRKKNPSVVPNIFMSDRDLAQMNALHAVYPESTILLCWWHVLHAWQQHIQIGKHRDVWELLKGWIRITSPDAFRARWEEIKLRAPPYFVTYLEQNWLGQSTKTLGVDWEVMWSAVYRQDRSIFEQCDTNMLIEAYHHQIKWKFLGGKRNRRVDDLLYTLTGDVLKYYVRRERRQIAGMEGDSLEQKEHKKIVALSKEVTAAHIVHCAGSVYTVRSLTTAGVNYRVNLTAATCTCPSFPAVRLCKHLYALQSLVQDFEVIGDGATLDMDGSEDGSEDENTPSRDSSPAGEPPATYASGNADPVLASTSLAKADILLTLDRLSAALRASTDPLPDSVEDLTVRALAARYAHVEILPARKKIGPNTGTAADFSRAFNMPKVKGSRSIPNPDRDEAYGGGAASGQKRKSAEQAHRTTENKRIRDETHIVSSCSLDPSPPLSLPSLPPSDTPSVTCNPAIPGPTPSTNSLGIASPPSHPNPSDPTATQYPHPQQVPHAYSAPYYTQPTSSSTCWPPTDYYNPYNSLPVQYPWPYA
ncbi:unnamed protein product [Peniophora sp. CBMAI 1063]|nr:unnamed protein product [Peniophora sp. CBMAI 1063]